MAIGNSGFTNWKWWFSIVTLVYQRVSYTYHEPSCNVSYFNDLNLGTIKLLHHSVPAFLDLPIIRLDAVERWKHHRRVLSEDRAALCRLRTQTWERRCLQLWNQAIFMGRYDPSMGVVVFSVFSWELGMNQTLPDSHFPPKLLLGGSESAHPGTTEWRSGVHLFHAALLNRGNVLYMSWPKG